MRTDLDIETGTNKSIQAMDDHTKRLCTALHEIGAQTEVAKREHMHHLRLQSHEVPLLALGFVLNCSI